MNIRDTLAGSYRLVILTLMDLMEVLMVDLVEENWLRKTFGLMSSNKQTLAKT